MNELFPMVCGTVVGLCCARVRGTRVCTAVWIALSLICGAVATLVSGEFKLGPQFLAFDTLLAGGAALGVMALGPVVRNVPAGPNGRK